MITHSQEVLEARRARLPALQRPHHRQGHRRHASTATSATTASPATTTNLPDARRRWRRWPSERPDAANRSRPHASCSPVLGDFGGHITGDDIAHLEVHGNEVVGAHLVPGLAGRRRPARRRHRGLHPPATRARASPSRCTCASACCPPRACSASSCTSRSEEDSLRLGAGALHLPQRRRHHPQDGRRGRHRARAPPTSTSSGTCTAPRAACSSCPRRRVRVGEGARFKTEFELIKGMAGVIDFDYEVDCDAHSTLDMIARIIGRGHDTDHASARPAA